MEDKTFIRTVKRDHPIFKNRVNKIFGISETEINEQFSLPIPNNIILCDFCNKKIEKEKINLLVAEKNRFKTLDEGFKIQTEEVVIGVRCETCIKEYHPNLKRVDETD
jgi:hypothetical protein